MDAYGNVKPEENSYSLFPLVARKQPSSLRELAIKTAVNLIFDAIENRKNICITQNKVKRARKYIRQNLPYNLLTEIFSRIFPTDRWSHPCSDPKDGNICRLHKECQVIYNHLPALILLLFSEDIEHVKISLRKVNRQLYKDTIDSFLFPLTKLPRRSFRLLNSFLIQSGQKNIEECIPKIEEMVGVMLEYAPNLEVLHLPIANNMIVTSVSAMKSLRVFKCDRSKYLNSRGISHLCSRESYTKYKLEVLHLGIFKHKGFMKEDMGKLLRFMENLKEFSFYDGDRLISRSPWHESNGRGDKVLSYSVFKLAIKQHEMKDRQPWPGGRIGPDLLATNLRELTVVDRILKPHYILESAPKLSSLILDWQEDYRNVVPSWFQEMIYKQPWKILASKLKKLSITFPAAYLPNAYSLPPNDFYALMSSLTNLTHLRLVGGGMNGPFPLIPLLRLCPTLTEFVLERTPIYIPHEMEPIRAEYKHYNLKKFSLLDELSSLTFHTHLTSVIATYMPNLQELEILPKDSKEFSGFTCKQIRELSRLKDLSKLAVVISTGDCTSNMPLVIYTLKEFLSLRYLILSWGRQQNNPIFDHAMPHFPEYLMNWLYVALSSNSANIDLQLSIKHHPQEYSAPSYMLNL